MAMSLDSCVALDGNLPPRSQPLTLDTYPVEGDQEALKQCRAFAERWNGKTGLGLINPRCQAPGMTGLMVGVYKLLLPRVQAELRQGAWVHTLEFLEVCDYPNRFGPVAERVYPAGLLVLDDLGIFKINQAGLRQLERLLAYRQQRQLATCFIAKSLEVLQERLTPRICSLLLGQCKVIEVYGPNMHALSGARNFPETAKEHPEWYDAYKDMKGEPTKMKWSREAAIERMKANTMLAEIIDIEPRIKPILDEAIAQRPGPYYNRVKVYTALKRRASAYVGDEAANLRLATNAHYNAVIEALHDLLPPDEADGEESEEEQEEA